MIRGSIDSNGDAILPLRLYGAGGVSVDVVAVIDTGFAESLSLPREIIDLLGLERREEVPFMLGDGSSIEVDLYAAQVGWFGRRKRVPVLALEGAPLIGMTMVRGTRLTIEAEENGEVRIEPL